MKQIFVALALVLLALGNALAESWYVVSATPQAAVMIDADSRKSDQNAFITMRNMHPGIQQYQGIPLIASQFRLEFDCKENRFRTVDFAMIDLDGRVPSGLESNKVRDWGAVEGDSPTNEAQQLACDGRLPNNQHGPYGFTDIEAKYLMWLQYGKGRDFSDYMRSLGSLGSE